jgi:hypothetical protein
MEGGIEADVDFFNHCPLCLCMCIQMAQIPILLLQCCMIFTSLVYVDE